VISAEHTWKTRFGGDSTFIGQSIRLGTDLYTVVGIVPDAATFPEETELWMPLATTTTL